MVSQDKKKLVKQIADLVKEYPIVGVVNMCNLPAPQMQKMRSSLRNSMKLVMTRKTLLARGLEASGKEGIKDLITYLKGMPALLFTKDNPFALYKTLEKNKSPAPAKAGQEAPKDIIVKAGPTSFAPGPVIGEMGALGIKTGVEGGKIAIKADSIVVKEGDTISAKAAEMLKRLGIEPMEIGLDLVAVFENGTVFKGSDLRIDEAEYEQKLMDAAQWAINLSVEAGIVNPDTIEIMLIKAFRDSKAVALEGNILADAVLEEVLAKVERGALALQAEAKIEAVAKPVEEKKEESKVEEKPKEAPKPEPVKEEPKPVKAEPKVEEEQIADKLEEAKKDIEKELGKEQGGEPPVPREEEPEEEKEEESQPEFEAAPQEEVKVEAPDLEEPKDEPSETERSQAPSEEELKEDYEEETPQEMKDPDYVPDKIEIKKPDIEKEQVEEIEEFTEPKEIIEDTPQVELTKREKEAAEEEAEREAATIGNRESKPDVEEMKSRADVLRERIKDMKKEESSPAVAEMVKKTKEFAEKGRGPSAADLLGEVEKEEKGPEEKQSKKEEVPSAQELFDRLKKKGTLRNEKTDNVPSAHELAKKRKK